MSHVARTTIMATTPEFDSIEDVLTELRAGQLVIVTDDEDRENEGDLILAAEKATSEKVAFMVKHTSGVVCVPMEGADLDRLALPLPGQDDRRPPVAIAFRQLGHIWAMKKWMGERRGVAKPP